MPEPGHVKIAVTTNSLTHVDVGFTQAQQIVFYDVSRDGYEFVDSMRFAGGPGGGKGKAGGGCWMKEMETDAGAGADRLTPRIEAVRGCQVVFTKGLSDLAAVRLRDSQVFPVKMETGREIDEVIDYLQRMMQGRPPLWLRKAMGHAQPNPEFQIAA